MKLICIDPGHGGTDAGACAGGAQEKYIALDISLKLRTELIKQGFDVCMTRATDIYDTPNKKSTKANSNNADIFISIHTNGFSDPSANGTETLCYELKGDCYKLAGKVQKRLVRATGLTSRGVKPRKDLIVLNKTKMPSILVETAFISNLNERRLLLNPAHQWVVAKAICDGVCEFFGVEKKDDAEMVEQGKIIVDGKEVLTKRILNDGTNYIAIRDIADILGYNIDNHGNVAVLTKK